MDASRGLPMDALDKRVHDSRPSEVHSLNLKIFKIFGNFSNFFPSTDGIFGPVSRIFRPLDRIFGPVDGKNFEKFPKILKIFKIKLWTLGGRESWTPDGRLGQESPRLASIGSPQLKFKNFQNFWKFFKIFSVDGRKIRFGGRNFRFARPNFPSSIFQSHVS